MDDMISRLAVIQIIEKMRARIGHNLERAVGGAMIEILDEVGEDVGKLPSALGTDLAEVGTDCISRQAAIKMCREPRMRNADCSDFEMEIMMLPPAQPETHEERTETHACDCISRKAAMELVKDVCDAIMSGCESWYDPETEDEVYKDIREVDAILKCNKEVRIALRNMPSAQPEIIRCRNCKFASGDSRICMQFGHSPIGELDFCAWAERRTDEE